MAINRYQQVPVYTSPLHRSISIFRHTQCAFQLRTCSRISWHLGCQVRRMTQGFLGRMIFHSGIVATFVVKTCKTSTTRWYPQIISCFVKPSIDIHLLERTVLSDGSIMTSFLVAKRMPSVSHASANTSHAPSRSALPRIGHFPGSFRQSWMEPTRTYLLCRDGAQ